MNFYCFVCNLKLSELEQLFVHLKSVHSIKSNSLYSCCVPNCKQRFSSFRSFSKHMKLELQNNDQISYNPPSTSINKNNISNNEDKIKFADANESIHYASDNNIQPINLNYLNDHALQLSLHYYGKINFSRKDATEVQKNISVLTNCIAKEIESKILTACTDPLQIEIKNSLMKIIDFCKNPFKNIDTEYKFLKHLKSNNLYEKSKIVTINNTIENTVINSSNTIDEKKVKGVLLPLKFQFRKYFELPGVLNSFLDNHNSMKSVTEFSSFVNSTLWKKKVSLYQDKLVIPYFLYFDDFEINNPLSSHSSSILGVYYSFPSAPHFLRSNLNNIFVAALFKSKDVKQIGNDRTFYNLIEEINDLETVGIEIQLHNQSLKVYFLLGLVIGDNLGVNCVLGFSKSFSALYFCRFCQNDKTITSKLCTEVIDSLRNKRNYDEDVAKHDFKQTGISEDSIFSTISSFHVVENYAVDMMHDLFEGICVYTMNHVILRLIDLGYFNLETVNNRKQCFNYGNTEIGNISPPLKLKNVKHIKFKMTASKMQTFIHFFPLIIGDLVPKNYVT